MSLPHIPISPDNRVGLRPLARNSLINFLRQGYAIVLALIISILLARGLGREGRGIYAVCILFPELLITLLNFGVSASNVYFISRKEYSPGYVLCQNIPLAIWMSLVAVLVGSVLIIILNDIVFQEIPILFLAVSLLIIPINMLNNMLISIFQGLQDFRSYNIPGMVNQFAMLVLVSLLVWVFNFGVIGAIIAYLLGAITNLASFLFLARQKIQTDLHIPIMPDGNYIRSIYQYGIKAHLSNMLSYLSYRLDNLILNGVAGSAAVGIYTIAVGLGERLWTPAAAISSALFPKIASLQEDEEKQSIITPLVIRFVFSLTLPVALVMGFIARWLIPFIYGLDFSASVLPFLTILPGITIFVVGKILGSDLAGRGRVGLNLVFTSIGFLVNLLSNLILIPRFGAVGAALSSSFSYSLVTILWIFSYRRITGIPCHHLLIFQKRDLIIVRQAIETLRMNINQKSKHERNA